MRITPMRVATAVLWPMTIWVSLTHFEEHAADDYVERTSPIVATAIAFWLCFGAIVALALVNNERTLLVDGVAYVVRMIRHGADAAGVLWLFLPVLYLTGLAMFTAREEAFPR